MILKLTDIHIFLLLLLFPLCSCAQENEAEEMDDALANTRSAVFGNPESQGVLRSGEMNEVSGIAVSSNYSNTIWAHNDSGNDPILFLIDQDANIVRQYWLEGIENRDWEDMAIGPGPNPDTDYIYLADIGDNFRLRSEKSIYRFTEPVPTESNNMSMDTIRNFERLIFSYPDQNHDAEALFVDPISQDLYIIAKDDNPNIYRLPAESFQAKTSVNAELNGVLEISGSSILSLVTAADISADGEEVLVKTYGKIFYWQKEDETISISELLRSSPDTLRYEPEPQGEAISFSQNPDGFYTLSEKRFGQNPVLYFYPRK